jgi:hypothetical protein
MGIQPRAKAIPHLLMSGDTITAVIKCKNLYDVTPLELRELMETFSMINGLTVLKPGATVMVPILQRHQAEVFELD